MRNAKIDEAMEHWLQDSFKEISVLSRRVFKNRLGLDVINYGRYLAKQKRPKSMKEEKRSRKRVPDVDRRNRRLFREIDKRVASRFIFNIIRTIIAK